MKFLKSFRIVLFSLVAVIFILLVACSPQITPTKSPGSQEGISSTSLSSEIIETTTPTQALPTSTFIAPVVQPTATEIPAQTSLDPCAYLTKEEITQEIGQTVVDAIPSDTPRPNCRYLTEPDASGYVGKIVVYVFTDPSASGGFEIGKTEQDENTQPIIGVGDDAYWSPTLTNLNVLYRNIYFTVQFLGTNDQTVDTAKELALKIIAHMQEEGVPD